MWSSTSESQPRWPTWRTRAGRPCRARGAPLGRGKDEGEAPGRSAAAVLTDSPGPRAGPCRSRGPVRDAAPSAAQGGRVPRTSVAPRAEPHSRVGGCARSARARAASVRPRRLRCLAATGSGRSTRRPERQRGTQTARRRRRRAPDWWAGVAVLDVALHHRVAHEPRTPTRQPPGTMTWSSPSAAAPPPARAPRSGRPKLSRGTARKWSWGMSRTPDASSWSGWCCTR